MNNNGYIPSLPLPNAIIKPQIIHHISPPILGGHIHTPVIIQSHPQHYLQPIVSRSQSFINPMPYVQLQHHTIPAPQPIRYNQSYPSIHNNHNYSNRSHSHSNSNSNSNSNYHTKSYKSKQEIIGDFIIDKQPIKSRSLGILTPHYKVSNDLPIELGKIPNDKNSKSLRNCFNCGGDHMIRNCKFKRDNSCIQFNRHLFDKYVSNKQSNKRRNKQKVNRPRNMRYYNSNASTASEQSFEDVNEKSDKMENESVSEEGEISDNKEEVKIGFVFDGEIAGLKIFRTKEEIESEEKEYQREIEKDKKEIESNKYKRNKYERSNYNRQRSNNNHSKYKKYENSKNGNEKKENQSNGNGTESENKADIDWRKVKRDRDHSHNRDRHHRSRDRDYKSDRRYDRKDRYNDRRRDRHSNEQIDYGFDQKKDRINRAVSDIKDRYQKNERESKYVYGPRYDRDRDRDRRRHRR